jgi:RNA polymerase sigma-70 factor (ECF subfamily)
MGVSLAPPLFPTARNKRRPVPKCDAETGYSFASAPLCSRRRPRSAAIIQVVEGVRGVGSFQTLGPAPSAWVVMLMQSELVWLLGAVAKGDEAAFERLYAATRAKLYGVLLRILGRPALAEEVMQETYLKVWKMADQFDPAIASPITWMVAMARNRAIDIVRKRGDVSIEDEPDALEVSAEAPAPLARREMTEELKRLLSCLGKLDPEKQRIVLLAYYSGWSRDQLAQKLDIPVNTIKTWLRRSLLEIRGCMGDRT